MVHTVSFFAVLYLTLGIGRCLSTHPKLIVISFDGFRHDYSTKQPMPALNRVKTQGSFAPHLYNVFPTKTFVNHHTIATGLFPESHNVLGNEVYDSINNKILTVYDAAMYSTNVKPIWVLNKLAGSNRYSGVSMWPGSAHHYHNTIPDFSLGWNSSVPWETRVDMVLEWFQDPVKPINLALMYFEEPDFTSHFFGPDDPRVGTHIQQVDNVIGYLQQKLNTGTLRNKINVIILSDHGMVGVTPQRTYNITGLIRGSTMVDTSPVLQIYPKRGQNAEIYNALKTAAQTANFSVYRTNEIPNRWHYRNSLRAPPILVVANVGYGFQDLVEWYTEEYHKKFGLSLTPTTVLGVHGYDNTEPSMWPIFVAWGPQVKVGHEVVPFNTVDLYHLFCRILDITPAANNGTFANVQDVLKPKT